MLSLIGQNWTHFLWALIATIMMVIIGFLTPLLLSEIVDSILGSEPFTMPDFLMNPINALGGRDFLRQKSVDSRAGAHPDERRQRRVHVHKRSFFRDCE